MNREEKIMQNVQDHYEEAKQLFPEDRIVGIFLQGSQNYGLDYEFSDIDTKLIVTPTLSQIAFNESPISTTYIRENNEHIDLKDIRLYIETFRKQNLNFLEILFTDFKIVNPIYSDFWNILVYNRELIAHYNPFRAVKSMKGIAEEKYHAMEHPYPSKLNIIQYYGYDCKQLHHLLRVEDYLERYIKGERYENCLKPTDKEYLIEVKRNCYTLAEARLVAEQSMAHVRKIADDFCTKTPDSPNRIVENMFKEVQYDIIQNALKIEILNS